MQIYCLSEKWSSREGILGTAVAGCALRIRRLHLDFRPGWRRERLVHGILIEGLAILGMVANYSPSSNHFVFLSNLAFVASGEIFKLLPSITADLLDPKMATINYGVVHTSKGTASIFVVMTKTSSSVPVFCIMIAPSVIAAFMALPFAKAACDRRRGPNLLEQKAETEAEKERLAAP
ncbi:MAG TPA: hypothetical protein VF740_02570 [Candidatus Acidoferrum sp.]